MKRWIKYGRFNFLSSLGGCQDTGVFLSLRRVAS
jgi:hypothetical protein